MENVLYFKNRQEWRSWLSQNHDKVNSSWLTFYKKNSHKKGISLEESVEEALCFGWIDGKLRRIDDERYALRFSPRKAKSVWSKINKDRAEKLIRAGKMTSAGLAKIEAAKKNGLWDAAYTNKLEDHTPSDLEKALMTNKEAWSNFQNLANSYKNMFIGWVTSAKTNETRQKRIEKVVEQAQKNKKFVFE